MPPDYLSRRHFFYQQKYILSISQRNFPVAVVDDFGHEVFGVFFGGGELLGDTPEAVFAEADAELLEDIAGAVDVVVAAAVESGEAEVHVGIIATAEGKPLAVVPGDFGGALPLPAV